MLLCDEADGTPLPAVIPRRPPDLVEARAGAVLPLPLHREADGALRVTVIT